MTSGERFSIRCDFNIFLPFKQEADRESLEIVRTENSYFWSSFFFPSGLPKRVFHFLFDYHIDHRSDSQSESITQNALLKLSS